MSHILASEPQSISGVLDQGFKLFRASFGRVLGLTLLCAALLLVVQGVQFAAGLSGMADAPLDLPLPAWFGRVAFGIAMLFNLAYFGVANAIWHRLWSAAEGSGSVGESLRVGARRLLPAIGAMLLFGLALVVSALPAGGAFFAFWPGRPVVAVLAALVLAALPIFVFTRLAFATVEVIVRPSGPIQSLRRSWELTGGNFWRVSGIGLVITVIAGVFYVAVGTIAGIGGFALADSPLGVAGITALILSALMVFVLPYTMAAWLVVWHDLRLRAEGGDLAARIDALAGD